MTAQQIQFEGWAAGTYSLSKRIDGTYYESDTAGAWAIWQDAQAVAFQRVDALTLERALELATKAGYKPSGQILKDAQDELMLARFAHLVANQLNAANKATGSQA